MQQPADTPAPPSEDAVTELMNAWWTATQAMKRHVAPMLEREHGLEFKDFIALSAIESGATYPGVVCSRLTMTPSTVSRLLDDLVRGGLLVRRLDDTDSRRVHLSLTPAGDTVLAATRQTMHAVLHRGLNGLPETQLQTFTQILRRMGETFNQSGTQSAAPPAEPTPPTSAPQKEYP
ncbi:MarR family winged helix-turn-helix transcriptional regulator [Deinococcus sp.]|uniref:MarR family winged helix-turn-helix transcriptional regulator n=1 Tax=Deinococcus sp. TaxID=47478 RepID=UPI002869D20C|nr:MarR family winged helix-turn-helix transcriptional regulator [Deinococcus sp.]